MNLLSILASTITIDQPLPQTSGNIVQNALYIAFGVLGGISFIVLVWAGFKYVMSSGDPQKTGEAKNQIMYAAIGIVVALSAEAIIKFAISRL